MSKIRINDLARELEVKPTVILDLLPELGVQDKKTHSSSLDEEVAIVVKERLSGMPKDSESHQDEPTAQAVAVEAPPAPEVQTPR